MASSVFTVRVPDAIRDQIETLADATSRSKSHIVNKAIEEYLQRNAWQARELAEALKEADKGVFVSGEAVEEWLDSWGGRNEKPAPKPDVRPVTKSRR